MYTLEVLEIAAFLVAGLAIALLVLPFVTFFRVHRLARELDSLVRRLEVLEQHQADAAPASPAAASAPAWGASPSAAVSAAAVSQPPQQVPATAVFTTVAEASLPPSTSGAGGGATDDLDFEGRVGGRGLLYTGLLILLFGVSFFLKYAFDNAWIGPWGRVGLGLVSGIALTTGGLLLDRRGLLAFGRALAGAGLAILYLSVYAALTFYGLIDRTFAFALMVGITAAAAFLADRAGAQSLAFVAVGGGFLTPFLVGGNSDAQLTLFTYDALLVVGTLLLATRHQWLGLNALSYVLTFVTVAAWMAEYYTDAKWRPTLLFLTVFCVLFIAVLRESRRATGLAARLVSGLLWTAPAFYHFAALAITSQHPPSLHVYLIAFTLAGILATSFPSRPWLRVLVLLAGVAPLFGYLMLPGGPSWLVTNVVTIVAVCGLHLVVLVERVSRRGEPLVHADLVGLHLAGLGLFGLLQQTLMPAFPAVGGGVAIAVAAVAGLLWLLFQPRDRLASLNAAALAFTLIAVAVALQFDGRVVVIGWAAEGAAVAWLGLRAPSPAFVAGGLALWAAAALRLADGYFTTPANFTALVNERSLATLAVIALGYLVVRAVRQHALTAPYPAAVRAGLHVGCSLLSLMWISAEIQSYWDVRYETPSAHLYEQLLLSLGWGLYGAAAVAVGMRRHYAPLRYIGIVVIGATVLKVFFVDLWDLGGIYRVIGFLTVGILLVLVSYMYQNRRVDVRDVPS